MMSRCRKYSKSRGNWLMSSNDIPNTFTFDTLQFFRNVFRDIGRAWSIISHSLSAFPNGFALLSDPMNCLFIAHPHGYDQRYHNHQSQYHLCYCVIAHFTLLLSRFRPVMSRNAGIHHALSTSIFRSFCGISGILLVCSFTLLYVFILLLHCIPRST